MKHLEQFYNERIKVIRPYSNLSQEEKDFLSDSLSFALFKLQIEWTNLKNAIKKSIGL